MNNSEDNENIEIDMDSDFCDFSENKNVKFECSDNENLEKSLNNNIKLLEQKYIELAKEINNQNDYLNKILNTKINELNALNDYNKIFSDHCIKGCNLENLYSLRSKISEMLEEISYNKERILNESKNDYIRKTMNNHICIICYENLACMLLKPCNHLSVCKTCGIGLDQCSICRGNIEERILVNYIENLKI